MFWINTGWVTDIKYLKCLNTNRFLLILSPMILILTRRWETPLISFHNTHNAPQFHDDNLQHGLFFCFVLCCVVVVFVCVFFLPIILCLSADRYHVQWGRDHSQCVHGSTSLSGAVLGTGAQTSKYLLTFTSINPPGHVLCFLTRRTDLWRCFQKQFLASWRVSAGMATAIVNLMRLRVRELLSVEKNYSQYLGGQWYSVMWQDTSKFPLCFSALWKFIKLKKCRCLSPALCKMEIILIFVSFRIRPKGILSDFTL